jgi:hypothetical protein
LLLDVRCTTTHWRREREGGIRRTCMAGDRRH